jgi:hypothetical protein
MRRASARSGTSPLTTGTLTARLGRGFDGSPPPGPGINLSTKTRYESRGAGQLDLAEGRQMDGGAPWSCNVLYIARFFRAKSGDAPSRTSRREAVRHGREHGTPFPSTPPKHRLQGMLHPASDPGRSRPRQLKIFPRQNPVHHCNVTILSFLSRHDGAHVIQGS